MEALENGAAVNRSCKKKYSGFDQVRVETAVNKVKSPSVAAATVRLMQSEKPKCRSNDSDIDSK